MADKTQTLQDALAKRVREYTAALEEVRHEDISNAALEGTRLLREAIEIVHCCRRLLKGRTPGEVHAAFGAPGDFGYDTPIGDALAALYRGGA